MKNLLIFAFLLVFAKSFAFITSDVYAYTKSLVRKNDLIASIEDSRTSSQTTTYLARQGAEVTQADLNLLPKGLELTVPTPQGSAANLKIAFIDKKGVNRIDLFRRQDIAELVGGHSYTSMKANVSNNNISMIQHQNGVTSILTQQNSNPFKVESLFKAARQIGEEASLNYVDNDTIQLTTPFQKGLEKQSPQIFKFYGQ